MVKKKTESITLDEMPFQDLGKDTMIALEAAGFEITAIATWSHTEHKMIAEHYFINRNGLCFLTGRSQSTIDYWINKGWLKPARKHGSYSLFALTDVAHLLETRQFPKANVTQIHEAAEEIWLDPPAEIVTEGERQAATKEAKKQAEASVPKGRRKQAS